MFEDVENCFRGLISALQIIKLYGPEHAKFNEFLEKAYDGFQKLFQERDKLVFGIVEEEIIFEKDVLFDLSKSSKPMIIYLKSLGIEKMEFLRPMKKEELRQFMIFLFTKKEEIKKETQEYFITVGIKHIIVDKFRGDTDKAKVMEAINYLALYSSSLENFSGFLENMLESKDVDYYNLRFNVASIFETLLSRNHELLKLTLLKRHDLNTFVHILNVSIFSMFFALKLGAVKDDVLEIGIAALFHDIGKIHISRKIIKKADKLDEQEFEKIKSHTLLGAEILLRYENILGRLPILAAFEHHLKSDFKGYPQAAFPRMPHLGSVIIGICDMYDALSSRRSYKSSFAPDVVYGILMKEKKRLHYPELVDYFFRIMGVWPIGTLVVLNDSRVAVVRDENEEDIFSPKVEIISSAVNREIIDLKENKQGIKIERFLDPLIEGKPYAKLV